jgi:hypothetical protein
MTPEEQKIQYAKLIIAGIFAAYFVWWSISILNKIR